MAEQSQTTGLSGEFNKRKGITVLIIALITILLWALPTSVFGIDALTITQQRVIAIFVMAVLLWLTEAIPSWATSVAIIFILLLGVSDSAFAFFQGTPLSPDDKLVSEIGTTLSYKKVLASFADPIVILFLGGFMLALAASKSGLDVLMAKTMIKPFGKKSENVLLGFILITGVFSMFVSNTATAAMMLTFLAPVFKALPANGKGRIALTMAIPIGANLGGIGTPIGTPPNAFALQALDEAGMGITFGKWMMVMIPYVIIMLLISWIIVRKLFPFTQKTIELKIEGKVDWNWRTYVVAITFIVTVLLWMFSDFTKVNANAVAMIPIAVFCITGICKAEDLKSLDWSVLWMVAGGFALGYGMNGTGLAKTLIEAIPFGSFSPLLILIVGGLVCYGLSNFISNTATAALLVPILAVVCTGMGDKLSAIGGTATVLVGIALAASTAMCLPISTPPNAIAYSTGLIKQNDMLKAGAICGGLSLILGYVMLIVIGKMGIFA